MIRTLQQLLATRENIIAFIKKAKTKKTSPKLDICKNFDDTKLKPVLPNDAAIAVVLFSGGGGIEAGMVQAGIRPAIAVEFDPTKPELSRAIAIAEAIRKLQPQVFTLENVPRYQNSQSFINASNTNITVLGSELIGTGNLQPNTKEKPVFRLGELVEFWFHGDGPPIRIVQGIQLINDAWFYSVEWISPSISEKGDEVFTSRDSIARVTDYDLERVRV